MEIECDRQLQSSHCTIYKRIEVDKAGGGGGGRLHRRLPRFGKTRWKDGKRKRHAGAKLIPHRVDIFFAKPYARWQRGINENTNGRLRRSWPKKFDIAKLTNQEVDKQIWLLNLTPRKVLNGLTPFEFFTGSRVALIA